MKVTWRNVCYDSGTTGDSMEETQTQGSVIAAELKINVTQIAKKPATKRRGWQVIRPDNVTGSKRS